MGEGEWTHHLLPRIAEKVKYDNVNVSILYMVDTGQ